MNPKTIGVGVLATGGLVAALVFGSFQHTTGPEVETAKSGCGIERWAEKTLTDPAASLVNLTPMPATVGDLSRIPAAPKGTKARLSAETKTYHVDADLISVKQEADSDFHLVLKWGGQTMIAEAPAPQCAAGSLVLTQITDVRAKIIAACGQPSTSGFTPCPIHVWVTGVTFLDFLHGQTGVAPNGVELHPLLDFYVTKETP